MESRNTDPSQFHDETHGPCIYSESTSLAIECMFCDQWNLKIHFLTCEIRGHYCRKPHGMPLGLLPHSQQKQKFRSNSTTPEELPSLVPP